jgi:retron-type reverse transcriptase
VDGTDDESPPIPNANCDQVQFALTVPTFEDKVAQRAITMVLESIYEQDFYPCSFGFRPGRSAHQALQALRTGFMTQGLRWVLDVDIRKYFDSIPHSQLREALDKRITEGVIRRMIDKWLKAGVIEDGQLRQTTDGSPQEA